MGQERRKGIAPAMTLLVPAPVVAEVLSGATRISYLYVLIPEIMVWGCGALMIREVVLRWGGGWNSMILLGLAWGVNWVYLLYMLGYESVWVVLVPVRLTQLIFPDRRHDRWLRTRGLVIAPLVFLLGAFIAWFTWTQQARTVVFHAPKYDPPPLLLAAGLLTIALLTVAAYAFRVWRTTKRASREQRRKNGRLESARSSWVFPGGR